MEVCDCFFKGTNGFLILLWQGIPSSASLGMAIQRAVSETTSPQRLRSTSTMMKIIQPHSTGCSAVRDMGPENFLAFDTTINLINK